MVCDAAIVRLKSFKDLYALKDTPPLACLYLAEELRSNGISCKIIDGLYPWVETEDIFNIVLSQSFRWLCLSVSCVVYLGEILSFADRIKRVEPGIGIILGGHFHSAELHRCIMRDNKNIDAIIIGEAEDALPNLIRYLEGNNDVIPFGATVRKNNCELKSYEPVPGYDDLDDVLLPSSLSIAEAICTRRADKMSIVASRGCYGACTFCSCKAQTEVSGFRYKWRGRSIVSVLDEMARYYRDFGATYFDFVDASFFGPGIHFGKERVQQFAEHLIKSNLKCQFRISCRPNDVDLETFRLLKRAGLDHVFIGIESGVETFLNEVNKGLSVSSGIDAIDSLTSLGIFIQAGFIMFYPWSHLQDLRANIELLKSLDSKILISDPSNSLYFFPGTEAQFNQNVFGEMDSSYYLNWDVWKSWKFHDFQMRYYYALFREILGPWMNKTYYLKYHRSESGPIRPGHLDWNACKALESSILDGMIDLIDVVSNSDFDTLSVDTFIRTSEQMKSKYELCLGAIYSDIQIK